ncbi:hypothetical protein [Alishewanella longhuensis]
MFVSFKLPFARRCKTTAAVFAVLGLLSSPISVQARLSSEPALAAPTENVQTPSINAEQVLFLGPLPAFSSEQLALTGKAKAQRQQLLRLLEKQPLPVAGRQVSVFEQQLSWQLLSLQEAAAAGPGLWFVQFSHPAYLKAKLALSGVQAPEIFLNLQSQPNNSELKLATGWQQLLIFQ